MLRRDRGDGHREFLRGLEPGQRQALNRRSDVKWLLHPVLHWGAIGLMDWIIVQRVPEWVVLPPVQGILLVFLFTLPHETSHMTPFRSVWLNRFAGAGSGLVILLPPLWFRYFHLAHHRYTQVPSQDPEPAETKPETRWQYVWYLSGLPAWAGQIRTLLRNAVGRCDDDFVPSVRWGQVQFEARVMLAVYAGVIVWGPTDLALVWLMPLLLGQPFLRLYLLAELGRCPMVADMFLNTRTTFTTGLVRVIAWNIPYHAEHHACPTVPFHMLPELHGLAAPHLQQTERGYLRFNRKYLNGLR